MPAILFGSISTIADTSELQRDAFNRAFAAHGLDWHWDQKEYRGLLQESGGAARIAQYAQARGETVDAPAIHQTKSELFQQSLAQARLAPRSGVVETIQDASGKGFKLAFVTTTSPENVTALITALDPELPAGGFDLIVDQSSVSESKPDRAAYDFALRRLGETADACIAVEDNVPGVTAAHAAGLRCVAFPNENTAAHDFGAADGQLQRLSFTELQTFVDAA